VHCDRRITATGVQQLLLRENKGLVHSKTIRRRIHESGLKSRKPRKLPLLSRVNKKKRLHFYQQAEGSHPEGSHILA
jgi:transposase